MVVEIPHVDGGSFRTPGNPVKLSDHQDTWESPPKLGQHTDQVLHDMLGKSADDIAKLRADGTIG